MRYIEKEVASFLLIMKSRLGDQPAYFCHKVQFLKIRPVLRLLL